MHSSKRCSLTSLLRHHQDPIAFPFEEGRGQGVSTCKSGQLLPYCWLGYPLWRNETWRFPFVVNIHALQRDVPASYRPNTRISSTRAQREGVTPPFGHEQRKSSCQVFENTSFTSAPPHLYLPQCKSGLSAIAFTPTRLMMPCPPPRVPPPHQRHDVSQSLPPPMVQKPCIYFPAKVVYRPETCTFTTIAVTGQRERSAREKAADINRPCLPTHHPDLGGRCCPLLRQTPEARRCGPLVPCGKWVVRHSWLP